MEQGCGESREVVLSPPQAQPVERPVEVSLDQFVPQDNVAWMMPELKADRHQERLKVGIGPKAQGGSRQLVLRFCQKRKLPQCELPLRVTERSDRLAQ